MPSSPNSGYLPNSGSNISHRDALTHGCLLGLLRLWWPAPGFPAPQIIFSLFSGFNTEFLMKPSLPYLNFDPHTEVPSSPKYGVNTGPDHPSQGRPPHLAWTPTSWAISCLTRRSCSPQSYSSTLMPHMSLTSSLVCPPHTFLLSWHIF